MSLFSSHSSPTSGIHPLLLHWNKGPHVGTTHRAKSREHLSAVFLETSFLLLTLLSLSPFLKLCTDLDSRTLLSRGSLSIFIFLFRFPFSCPPPKILTFPSVLSPWMSSTTPSSDYHVYATSMYLQPWPLLWAQPKGHPPNKHNTPQAQNGSHQLLFFKTTPLLPCLHLRQPLRPETYSFIVPPFLPLFTSPPHTFYSSVPCLFTWFSCFLKDSAHTSSSPRWLPGTPKWKRARLVPWA